MYDIKRLEAGQQQQQHQQQQQQQKQQHNVSTSTANIHNDRLNCVAVTAASSAPCQLTCSVITAKQHAKIAQTAAINYNPAEATHMTLLTLRRRRMFQRRACLLSILAAFVFGLALGVFVPMFGLPEYLSNTFPAHAVEMQAMLPLPFETTLTQPNDAKQQAFGRPPSDFPTIYETGMEPVGDNAPYTVAFIKDEQVELSAEQVFRNAFHLEQDKNAPDSMIVKKLDTNDGSIKEFHVQRTSNGRFRKGPERRLSKPTIIDQIAHTDNDDDAAGNGNGNAEASINFVPMAQRIVESARSQRNQGIIKSDIYWGELVERALPKGFGKTDTKNWDRYVAREGVVARLEAGCGRMQNRLVVFADGTRACARYRQNTDQIQGELFSFFLGQLLNITNLAPSAATVIDTTSRTWSAALGDITQAQWKEKRPVVLTRWLPDLEPAGIPQPFQPLERHLNKYDVWNITLGAAAKALQQNVATAATASVARATHNEVARVGSNNDDNINDAETNAVNANVGDKNQRGLLKRLEPTASQMQYAHQSRMLDSSVSELTGRVAAGTVDMDEATASGSASTTTVPVLQRLIELAQWSDLIVFDYLIANLDRVVNNLYNFQWNADIMAAPAHNLARQINSQLLVFLDNESGLLHGYRLLKKYEAYHSLLLDNLCVFRQPTIEALQRLRNEGAGHRLRELFEQTTSADVRDVLPSLPDKSIKILVDRIDRVLGQVQKCRDLLADR